MGTDWKQNGLYGPSIQIDPLFPYYQDRSPASIAEEIELAGYRIVRYFVVNETKVSRALIDAFHDRGMFVWALVLGNGTFSTEGLPKEWPEWKMGLIKEVEDGYTRLSLYSEGYRSWKSKAMADLVSQYPFDGIEIAEPYFPEWDGINRGVYGDVGPHAQRAFRLQYGMEMPDFVHPRSRNYYKNQPGVYRSWVEFRVQTVNDFLDLLINGEGGVREVRPDLAVATWSLAVDDGTDSMERLRELQGLDAPAMIDRVKPDMHVLQTHWPDWTKEDLPATYVRGYKPFIEAVRTRHPELPLAVQADIGSARHMIKDQAWLEQFQAEVNRLGFASWTAYEYHLGGYMYDSRPVPLRASISQAGGLTISFNKRIDEASRLYGGQFAFYRDGMQIFVPVESVQVDGNRLILRSRAFPPAPFDIRLPRIKDTPERWHERSFPSNEMPAGTQIRCEACP